MPILLCYALHHHHTPRKLRFNNNSNHHHSRLNIRFSMLAIHRARRLSRRPPSRDHVFHLSFTPTGNCWRPIQAQSPQQILPRASQHCHYSFDGRL